MNWPWSELGLPGPAGLPEIRRAYARRLKNTHPEDDPEGFQRLHAAYQEAGRQARRTVRTPWEPPETPPEKGPEADWDYGEREEPRTDDWDYERLFAEGEAEAREAFRRKVEELRQKNWDRYAAREQEQRGRAGDEEESWSAVMTAARALELLYANGAPLPHWRGFLNDPVFLNVRANLDFIFVLEDFLEQHPDLPPDIRQAVFAAYGFERGPGNPAYKRLYRLLNVSRGERRRMRRAKSQWRNTWRRFPAWRKAVCLLCFAILAVFFFTGLSVNLRQAYRDFTQRRSAGEWEAQSLAWLEEDFGEPFVRADRENHLYTPASDPALYFWVLPDGERTEDGRPGYRTDYPHMRVMRAMKDFAEKWDLGLEFDSAGEGYSGKTGDAPGAYLFDLPLEGAEEAISALGALARELEAQEWNHVPADEGREETIVKYQIFLCHNGLSFYDAISTQEGGFDADVVLERYKTAGSAYCRYIVEHSGLAAGHMGEDAYALLDLGTAELDGHSFFLVTGLDKESQEPLMRYFMAVGGGSIFCVPESKLGDIASLVDLYRGFASLVEVEQVGRIMIWDLT